MKMAHQVLRMCAAATVACLLPGMTQAGVLVQETFDNYATGNLAGATASATGLTGTYTLNGGSGASIFTVAGGNLSFGSLNTGTGNHLVFRDGNNESNNATVQLSLSSSPVTGSLYTSYLFNIATRSTSTSAWSQGTAINNSATGTAGSGRFRTLVDSGTVGSTQAAASYGSTTVEASGAAPTAGTTYLLIARYTRVGESLSSGSPGVATLWILTLDQFNQAGGSLSDSYLDSAAVGSGANDVFAKATSAVTSGTFNFQSGNYLQLANVAGPTTTAQAVAYDRITFGNSLTDIVPVPEPASVALVVAGVALAGGRRRA